MNLRLLCAAVAASALLCQLTAAQAGCVIAPDGNSINVVTDNGSSDEKSCQVSCQVDTKIGVVKIGCGGTTPPLAKAHPLCDFDKPDAYYKKVISAEDSCKASDKGGAPAPAKASVPAAPKTDGFTCRISPDGKTVDAMIANPYKITTSCQVNCQVSTTKAGTTLQASCTREVAPGGPTVLCSNSVDSGSLVKMVGGSGSCVKPLDPDEEAAKEKAEEQAQDAEVQKFMNRPMPKPSAANKADDDELAKIGNDPEKMQQYMQKKMDEEMRKALGK